MTQNPGNKLGGIYYARSAVLGAAVLIMDGGVSIINFNHRMKIQGQFLQARVCY